MQRKGAYANPNGDLYLGMLYSMENYKMYSAVSNVCVLRNPVGSYGYVTNTKMKFVVVLHELVSDPNLKTVSSCNREVIVTSGLADSSFERCMPSM